MNIEQQVCSLPLARKLKELGVKQESLFVWAEYPHLIQQQEDGTSKCIETITEIRGTFYFRDDEINTWSAFTVAELGVMLPNSIIQKNPFRKEKDWEHIEKNVHYNLSYNGGHPSYDYYEYSIEPKYEENDTESDARAKILIYLIENKLIEVTSNG